MPEKVTSSNIGTSEVEILRTDSGRDPTLNHLRLTTSTFHEVGLLNSSKSVHSKASCEARTILRQTGVLAVSEELVGSRSLAGRVPT